MICVECLELFMAQIKNVTEGLTILAFCQFFLPLFILVKYFSLNGSYMFCISVCRDNFYGGDCNTSCGHCINADMCNKVTGQCSNGCQNHWTGDRCDGNMQIMFIIAT